MSNGDSGLDDLFEKYRTSCTQVDVGANFMPNLWRKIESRSFGFAFQRFAGRAMTASAALCLLLAVLNLIPVPHDRVQAPTYADALLADHSAEKTYYAEAIWTAPANASDTFLQ